MKINIPIMTSFKICGKKKKKILGPKLLSLFSFLIGKHLLGYQRYQVLSERP